MKGFELTKEIDKMDDDKPKRNFFIGYLEKVKNRVVFVFIFLILITPLLLFKEGAFVQGGLMLFFILIIVIYFVQFLILKKKGKLKN